MRIPTSTYRLQITADFDLAEASRRLAYLHRLGVDWVYLSPLLAAEEGSEHGYDVVAHDHVDDARGGAEGLARLSSEARRLGMGVLVDIVPNHVGVATPRQDPWWWDVLKNGRSSEHAAAFDVDWNAGHDRLQIPVVGDDDQLVEGGAIAHLEVVADPDDPDGQPVLTYHDHVYPIAPGTADDLGAPLPDSGPGEGPVVDAEVVHGRQHYELVGWRHADDALNYRRFFAVNTLAAVRVEEPEVFAETHAEIGRWFREGLVDGLRVDHPDGLRDPQRYLDDLAELTGGAYVLVEKILEHGEDLPRSWRTAGTTGYDVLGAIDRVLTDPAAEQPLDELETTLRGAPVDWGGMVHDRKREVADTILRSEVKRIVRDLRRHLPVVPAYRAEDAVAELLACFPVYRSYLPEGREHLDAAFAAARARRPELGPVFDALEPWLFDPDLAAAKRFQQTSGMVMAKGVEDCAFYRWSRLTSLNEVGGDPAVFAVSVAEFHAAMARREAEWPHAMTTTSTHDTKRGEDVRARIGVLAEIPEVWAGHLVELLTINPVPDRGFGGLLVQAALGAWPLPRERLHAYAEKAMREAGDHTTWTDVDADYEAAVHRFVDALYDEEPVRAVFAELLAHVVAPGWSNALAAKLLALTMPGVPDVYQGSELWEQSLVDPDNRRPIDLDRREELLAALVDGAGAPLTASADDPGVAKLLLTHRALTLRRERPELFSSYTPVRAVGPAADHVVAYDRGGAIAVATRLPVGLVGAGGWRDTRLDLPSGRWRDELTGAETTTGQLGCLLATYPVALLVRVQK
ncbi:malto-oligosyltrehalose synthase [Nocardioides sp. DS6]|uniref:Malto-oligosyltrehalose synthase n=1 Tax=Nocardioides eburneus TaxID=3231482 RepID=A0ABV3ST72_9ACTN